MPSKHVIRQFKSDGFYHVYNRGVEKRVIFADDHDYKTFLYYLNVYLLPPQQVVYNWPDISPSLLKHNMNSQVELLCYCLMPNHFHLLLRQTSSDALPRLMKQLTNAYTRYFNGKYSRVGSLMQGPYKAVEVLSDSSLLQLSRYVHLNPLQAGICPEITKARWTSLSEYLSPNKNSLCATNYLSSHFHNPESFLNFTQLVQPREYALKDLMNDILIEESASL